MVEAIEDATRQIRSQLVVEQLWLYEVEIKLGWLQSLAALTRRAEKLEAELHRRGVRIRKARQRKGAAARRTTCSPTRFRSANPP